MLPLTPQLCHVCMSTQGWHVVPDRCPQVWRFDVLCPVCVDALLAVFPLVPAMFGNRELTGSLRRSLHK